MVVFLGYNQYWPVGLWFCVFVCPGTPKDSTGSGFGFKASQKTRPRLKVSSDRLEKPRIEPATPGLQDIGLSPKPLRLLSNIL